MDPLSISASVTALLTICLQITKSAASFTIAISDIDETIADLFSEIEELQTVTENIKSTLDSGAIRAVQSSTGHEAQHWRCVERVLEQCRSTVLSLHKDLTALEAARGSNKLLGRLQAHFKSLFSEKRIKGYYNKIASSKDTLQISFQLLTLLSASENRDSLLVITPRLDDLMALVQDVHNAIMGRQENSALNRDSGKGGRHESDGVPRPSITSTDMEHNVDDLAELFNTQCCIDCVRNAGHLVSMTCTVVSELETVSIFDFNSLKSGEGRVDGWLENIESSPSDASIRTVDVGSVITQILSKFEYLDSLLAESTLDEADAQCAALTDDIKSAYGARYKRATLFQRLALAKSILFRKKSMLDESEAWSAFSEKLCALRLERPNSVPEKAPIGKGVDIAAQRKSTAFLNSVRNGDFSQVRTMVQKNPDLVHCWSQSGETPLHWAAWYQAPDICELLLVNSAEVNTPSRGEWSEGFTALHHAATRNDEFIVEILIKNGASVNSLDSTNRTPLHYAAICRSNEAARSLIQHGATPNAVESMERGIPLHYAAADENLTLTKLLLEIGSNINAQNIAGQTCLIYAVKKRKLAMAKYLVNSGADVDIKDNLGKTARDYHPSWPLEVESVEKGEKTRRKRKFES
ncbi:hypothetical protein TWF694_011629 [Orbilia ellipsospora]|uniref:Azaphilone pigments biosynthesis cluster protein L N-terminal domain-containing protein n=1 Tax=Orbilia ellipsospora TaxID=2528407 RepID=A0AAV9X5T4_9PEZI